MTRRLGVLAALVVGVVAGVVVGGSSAPDRGGADAAAPTTTTTAPATAEVPIPASDVLLVWSPGGLPPGLGAAIGALPGVEAVAVVLGDIIGLTATASGEGVAVDEAPAGFAVPVEAAGFDCAGARALLPDAEAAAICALAPDDVLLGEASARLRRIGAGALVRLADGRDRRVAGVVADDVVGAAELVLSHDGARAAGVDVERYALVRHTGDRAGVEAAIRAAAGRTALRVRGPGETPFFRHGDAVLPQALVKERFGEFAARPGAGGALAVSPSWRDDAIVTADVPLLGRVPCHRRLVPALTGALEELVARGLVTSVDRSASGCFNPRRIAGTDQPSRHAWGIAVDLVGAEITAEVVEVFERWGFTWGGHWLTPDPVHFEYVREPS